MGSKIETRVNIMIQKRQPAELGISNQLDLGRVNLIENLVEGTTPGEPAALWRDQKLQMRGT